MPARRGKNISLTPSLERFIAQRVASGGYQTASEVVREALRLLAERERERAASLDRVRRKIAVGLDQARRGELVDGEQAFREAEAKILKQASNRRKRAG